MPNHSRSHERGLGTQRQEGNGESRHRQAGRETIAQPYETRLNLPNCTAGCRPSTEMRCNLRGYGDMTLCQLT
jgi:hypothetical protein